MVNNEKHIFFRVFGVIIMIFLINFISFIYKYNIRVVGITGHSVKSDVIGLYNTLSSQSKIFLIAQWGVLVLILIYASFKDKGASKRNNELVGINLKRIRKDSKTDLDALYDILKTKKQLSIITIKKIFKIPEKLALEWAKILESGNLAYIDYPRFGGVVLKLKEHKKIEDKKGDKEDKKKLNKKIKKREDKKFSKIKPRKLKQRKIRRKKVRLDRKTKKEVREALKEIKKQNKEIKKKK